MDFNVDQILKARERIAPYIVETPLLRLRPLEEALGCEVYVKLENFQITGAFKLRGAFNKILSLSKEELARGVVTASSGNHGAGVAYAAGMVGAKATVVIPNTAPKTKVDAIRALGAEIVFSSVEERMNVAHKICDETGGIFIPPFSDEFIMAGQGTAGLEISEQCPDLDTVIVPVAGGGLISGISTAVKARMPRTKVYGAEPSARPRYTVSLAEGKPVQVENHPSVADALASTIPGEKCYPVVSKNTDGFFVVDDEYMLKAMKLLLFKGKILAEPSSCIGMGAILQGKYKPAKDEKVCFVISGGSVGLDQLGMLENVEI